MLTRRVLYHLSNAPTRFAFSSFLSYRALLFWASLTLRSSCLCLLSSWNYRHVSLSLGPVEVFFLELVFTLWVRLLTHLHDCIMTPWDSSISLLIRFLSPRPGHLSWYFRVSGSSLWANTYFRHHFFPLGCLTFRTLLLITVHFK
jgi:hypothetical protein